MRLRCEVAGQNGQCCYRIRSGHGLIGVKMDVETVWVARQHDGDGKVDDLAGREALDRVIGGVFELVATALPEVRGGGFLVGLGLNYLLKWAIAWELKMGSDENVCREIRR